MLAERMRAAAGGPVDVVVDPLVRRHRERRPARARPSTAGWCTSAPAAVRRPTFSSAALRSGSHSILGYTNNALTAAQKAAALGAVLEHRCTVTYETVGLDAVADGWTRAGAAPNGRVVVVP